MGSNKYIKQRAARYTENNEAQGYVRVSVWVPEGRRDQIINQAAAYREIAERDAEIKRSTLVGLN